MQTNSYFVDNLLERSPVWVCSKIFPENMAWPNQDAGPWSFVLLLTFLAIFPEALSTERKPSVHLEYVCAEPKEEKAVPVVMLHGLVDIKETWNGIYQNVSALTNRKVCIYDARNHGGSSWNDTLGIDALVEDLDGFMNMMKMERAVIVGHSMGGQTAMKFALSKPNKVDGIFVEDIGMNIPMGVETVVGYVVRKLQKSLSAIPEGADDFTARTAVASYMKKATGQGPPNENYFKAFPLHFQDGVWKWKTNFQAIENFLDNLYLYDPKMDGLYEGKALFIYGKSSVFKIWEEEESLRKLFPNAKFVGIEGANHLIHFYEPEFMEELITFLT